MYEIYGRLLFFFFFWEEGGGARHAEMEDDREE